MNDATTSTLERELLTYFDAPEEPEGPWRWLLEQRGQVLLLRAPIAERGRYYRHLGTIVLRDGMSAELEYDTLGHEVAHAIRGDVPSGDEASDARMEAAAETLRLALFGPRRSES